jgi:hypothetical protein
MRIIDSGNALDSKIIKNLQKISNLNKYLP